MAPKEEVKGGVQSLGWEIVVLGATCWKRFGAPPASPKTSRAALGTVNRATEKLLEDEQTPLKTLSIVKKVIEKNIKIKTSVSGSGDTYPEIQKRFPFSHLDFESFDLPKEHQITHDPLNEVSHDHL